MRRYSISLAALLAAGIAAAQEADNSQWIELFNGRDLSGWIPKIRGYAAGENYANTFRVEDGLLNVAYDEYDDFAGRFGHLFYEMPYSHYRLRIEYRFVDGQAPNGPDWALRNSGVMLHSQPPETMHVGQDFPISVEVQFLGGVEEGVARPTGNVCTPGTHIVYAGSFTDTHCIDSTSPTLMGDQWVLSETVVMGNEAIVHFINGEKVIEYGGVTTGGGVVSDYDPALKPEGRPLESGYIALQSESHPIHFRRVELLNLKGCMDDQALNFKPWYREPDPQGCRYE